MYAYVPVRVCVRIVVVRDRVEGKELIEIQKSKLPVSVA